jgi:hypothetical protein
MRKYIGTRPISQKTKKSNKSSERKTPSIPVSRKRNRAIYIRTFSLIPNEARIARGVSNVVSSTMVRESPSIPRWKYEPISVYQGAFTTYLKPSASTAALSKPNQATTAKIKGTRLAINADVRMSFVESFGKSSNMTAAIEGANKMIVSKEFSIVSLPAIEW